MDYSTASSSNILRKGLIYSGSSFKWRRRLVHAHVFNVVDNLYSLLEWAMNLTSLKWRFIAQSVKKYLYLKDSGQYMRPRAKVFRWYWTGHFSGYLFQWYSYLDFKIRYLQMRLLSLCRLSMDLKYMGKMGVNMCYNSDYIFVL